MILGIILARLSSRITVGAAYVSHDDTAAGAMNIVAVRQSELATRCQSRTLSGRLLLHVSFVDDQFRDGESLVPRDETKNSLLRAFAFPESQIKGCERNKASCMAD